MTTFTTQGTVFKRGNDASPQAFVAVGQVTGVTPIGQKRDLIDVTNLASLAREYKKAIKDGQEINVEIQYDPQDSGHEALRDDLNAETARNYQIVLTDSPATTIGFAALVTNWSITDVAIDQVYKLEVTLKPTGDLTFS